MERSIPSASPSGSVWSSFAWLNAERVIRLTFGFVQTSVVARYLGPDGFGTLSGSIALVTMMAGICTLGTDSILARRLALDVRNAGTVIGTAVTLRVLAGVGMAAVMQVWMPDGGSIAVHAVISWSALGYSLQVGDAWFASTGMQRPAVMTRLGVFIAGFAARLALVASGAGLVAFAVVFAVELALSALLVLICARVESEARMRVKWTGYGCDILLESWPAMVSMVSVAVCSRIDLVLVTQFVRGDASGSYAAATRLNELFHFVPTAMIGATIGALVRLHGSDSDRYRRVQAALSGLAAWGGLAVALFWLATAGLAVRLVFGERFPAAAMYLRVLAIGNMAVFAGAAWSVFWLAHRRQAALMQVTISSAGLSLLLSFVLLQHFGPPGAALGALAGQFLPFLVLQVFPEGRAAWGDMVGAVRHPIQSANTLLAWRKERAFEP